MPRKKTTITLSIPDGTKEQLEEIARSLGIFWGKTTPSISGLLVAIAQQKPEVNKLFTLTSEQVAALQQASRILVDTGYVIEAQTLLSLLLAQGNLETPLYQALTQLISHQGVNWRSQIDDFQQRKQPFKIGYRNAQGEILEFTARYAEVSFQEKRFYLTIWCNETEDIKNPDFPELIHNRCLRMDRITHMEEVQGQWRGEGLDFIKVYLHFSKGLAKAYEPRSEDIDNRVIGDVRQVERKVSNPFWLIREVLRYGEDCVVVSPENVRSLIKQKILTLCDLYDIETRD
ncbi:helix-turn-helix transcriptional regulator [Calothrix sp. UHCC 0171]|uniref:helix-turn-helix transcriptional regulator n=1 Tax=Calothrix sp. UHCC 0171 TaxID=3110245 RepID=UPI002B20DF56|nr:WYL domain-containing protein [Calothrix sp. UHCC 0171]MEA5571988.1 WYL domain-containing protein [Calothrix sp. UHCC 0171]